MYVCLYMYVCICMYVHVCTYMYVCVCVCVCICVYVSMYACMYLCYYVCMDTCICMHNILGELSGERCPTQNGRGNCPRSELSGELSNGNCHIHSFIGLLYNSHA